MKILVTTSLKRLLNRFSNSFLTSSNSAPNFIKTAIGSHSSKERLHFAGFMINHFKLDEIFECFC